MSTTVTYKGQTLTTVENQTKTLNTAGTWVEGDFTLTDVTQGGGGEWTTEGIANRTEPNGALTFSYQIRAHAFRDCTGITSVTFAQGASFNGSDQFNGCSGITEINASGNITLTAKNCFAYCTGLTDIYIGSKGLTSGTNMFSYCSNLETARFPYHALDANGNEMWAGTSQMGNGMFRNDSKLTLVDYGHANGQFADCFMGCTALRTLILRRIDSVCGINAWSTKAMGGIYDNPTESTIYVPQALISSYQSATNWSTGYAAGLTFLPIEGSEYEL